MEKAIPYYDFVRKLFNRSGDPSKDFAHAILGIVTESHELLSATDEVNALEEQGDLMFYLHALQQVIEDTTSEVLIIPDNDYLEDKLGSPADFIAFRCNELLDHAKRWVGYGKMPHNLDDVFFDTAELVWFLNTTGPYPQVDTDRIKAVNMAKLLKRYPGGEFDAYRAVVRDLEGERVVLQTA